MSVSVRLRVSVRALERVESETESVFLCLCDRVRVLSCEILRCLPNACTSVHVCRYVCMREKGCLSVANTEINQAHNLGRKKMNDLYSKTPPDRLAVGRCRCTA